MINAVPIAITALNMSYRIVVDKKNETEHASNLILSNSVVELVLYQQHITQSPLLETKSLAFWHLETLYSLPCGRKNL